MRAAVLIVVFALAGCTSTPESAGSDPTGGEATAEFSLPSDDAVSRRVTDATARLEASEAGRIVLAAIDAHGGLEQWYANGPIHFRYTYNRLSGDPPIDTEQIVDTWSARAHHTLIADTAVSFGWTGQEAWVQPDSAVMQTNPRFWSLTPYYFVAMPFVLADPGVQLDTAGQMTTEGTTYDLVHVTFEDGTGDAPDDYYYLLLDPATRRVGGVRYVVSYPGFFPEGGATPEKLMLYDGAQTASGITLQEGFRSFAWTDDGAGAPSAEGAVTDLRFVHDAPDRLFAVPTGARVLEGL